MLSGPFSKASRSSDVEFKGIQVALKVVAQAKLLTAPAAAHCNALAMPAGIGDESREFFSGARFAWTLD